VITEDLKDLKHAYFTDPKDQSPWNYHAWLISLISPIQVVALRYLPDKSEEGKTAFVVGLSHQVKHFERLNISLVDAEGNQVEHEVSSAVPERRSLSTSFKITFDSAHVAKDRNSFTLKI